MTIACSFEGLPNIINVTTSLAFNNAITTAPSGSVVTLTEVVGAFVIAPTTQRRSPGICAVLPPTQVVAAEINTQNLWLDLRGGTYSKYTTFAGSIVPGASGAYSVNSLGGSRFAIRGARFTYGSNLCNMYGSSFFEITDTTMDTALADLMSIRYCSNFLLDNMSSKLPTAKSYQLGFYTDGTAPIDGRSKAYSESLGAFWRDGPHADVAQITGEETLLIPSSDFRVSNFDIQGPTQGIIGFQTTETKPKWLRAEIINNKLRLNTAHTIAAVGGDVLLANNDIGPDPDDPGDPALFFTMTKHPVGTERFRAGENTLSAGVTIINTTGISPTGPISGDNVVPPALPNLPRLPWAPPVVKRADIIIEPLPPVVIIPPTIASTVNHPTTQPSSVVSGTWLTTNLGSGSNYPSDPYSGAVTWEVQWMRNGVNISGATSRTFRIPVDEVSGVTFTVKLRATSTAYGVTSVDLLTGNGPGWSASSSAITCSGPA
jgi:hypothetical protein